MKLLSKFQALLIIFALLPALAFASDESQIIDEYYDAGQIIKNRENINKSFKFEDDSPLTSREKKKFKSLKYFKPDKKYIFFASFVFFPNPDTLIMRTSKKDKTRKMLKAAKITFHFNENSYVLFAYLAIDRESKEKIYFVPFTDLTNGKETYEAGRYIDIYEADIQNGFIIFDFNSAYNPYCAYNDKYSCPLVPPDNHLEISINAGEKKYYKK